MVYIQQSPPNLFSAFPLFHITSRYSYKYLSKKIIQTFYINIGMLIAFSMVILLTKYRIERFLNGRIKIQRLSRLGSLAHQREVEQLLSVHIKIFNHSTNLSN